MRLDLHDLRVVTDVEGPHGTRTDFSDRPASIADWVEVGESLGAGRTWLCASTLVPRCSEDLPPVFGPEGHSQCGWHLVYRIEEE